MEVNIIMYFNAIKGSIIFLIIFIILVIYIPGYGPSGGVEIILTISTFLFAIIAGFFISRLNSRYDKIRELVADEDAFWFSFYKAAQFLGKRFVDKVRELIDKYYIVMFDFDLGGYYKHTAKYFNRVYKELENVKIKGKKAEQVFDDMVDYLSRIEENRNISSVVAVEKLSKGQWAVLLFLAGIIVFSIFFLKTTEIYSQIFAVILSTVLVLVLLIVRDLQNMRLTGEIPAVESGQEMFDLLGKMRYYPERDVKDRVIKIPENIKEYRVGLHKPGDPFKIKIVINQ